MAEKIEDGAYGFTISGLNVTNAALGTSLKKGIISEVRPNNIGKGGWAKMVSEDLDDVARIFGASEDDVIRGYANAEADGLLPNVLNWLAYAGAFIDAGIGIKENVEAGSTWQKTTSDAAVDLTVSGASICASSLAGAGAGFLAGSFVPGIGNVVGAVVGFVAGIWLYYYTDIKKFDGKTFREHLKDDNGFLFWRSALVGRWLAMESQA